MRPNINLHMNKVLRWPGQHLSQWGPLCVLLIALMISAGCVPGELAIRAQEAQALAAAMPQSSPIIAVAPLAGQPGTMVAVAGSGWQPDETIRLRLESTSGELSVEATVATTVTDETGRFSTTFLFPEDAQWLHATDVLLVVLSAQAEQVASQTFQLRPSTETVLPIGTVLPTETEAAATAGPSPTAALPLLKTATVLAPTAASTPPTLGAGTVAVISRSLNVRRDPSTTYAPIATVHQGDLLIILAQTADGSWLRVRLPDGTDGWVARSFTTYGQTGTVLQPPIYASPTPTPSIAPTSPSASITEWRGEYYANRDLTGSPALVRNDSAVDFNWGQDAPAAGLPSDNFSVRWTRSIHFEGDRYRFHARVDDGVRLYVDNNLVIDQWRDGSTQEHTGEIDLGSGSHTVRVEYYDRGGHAEMAVWWERYSNDDHDTDDDDDDFPDWKGEYYTNRDLDDDPRFRRNDKNINFNWGDDSPSSRIPDDNFSVRWTQRVRFDEGRYRFHARADDGVRFYIDGRRVLNEWHDNDFDNAYSVERDLDGRHDLKVEYYEHRGGARIDFWWERIDDDAATATPTATPTLANTTTITPTLVPSTTATVVPTLAVQPSANVQPASGNLDANLTVSGGGFPANTVVNVHLGALIGVRSSSADQEIYATTTTDRTGSYSVSFDMPAAWRDAKPITSGRVLILVATEDQSAQASAIFAYTAEPSTPTPTGTLLPTDTPLPTATPTATSIVPTVVGTATPVPQPYMSLQPAAGGPGTQVSVKGGGFPANVHVNTYLGIFDGGIDPNNATASFASTLTDDNGNYSMSFVMPETTPGGNLIPSGRMAVVVATNDFGLRTSSTFDYAAAQSAEAPTDIPTAVPEEPTAVPEQPTAIPTAVPEEPTAIPTDAPEEPTAVPEEPTAVPTEAPTAVPEEPTAIPEEPTAIPTDAPEEPTAVPEEPTAVPEEPTAVPEEPTAIPEEPTAVPEEPTAVPIEKRIPTPTPVSATE